MVRPWNGVGVFGASKARVGESTGTSGGCLLSLEGFGELPEEKNGFKMSVEANSF